MYNQNKTIVAIELASSKISGIVGEKTETGSWRVLGYASAPAKSCVKNGSIYNFEKTRTAVGEVLCRLENMMAIKVNQVFIGYNSKGLKSMVATIEKSFPEETVITQEIIDDMFCQCEQIDYPGQQRLLMESQEYIIDGKSESETEPMGVACTTIVGKYLNILKKAQNFEFVDKCLEENNVSIVEGYVTLIAEADAVLSDDDKRRGCALIDFGADNTSVAVYKDGILKRMRVIPLGSNLITRDLSQILKIDMDEAEDLKRKYGLCNLQNELNSDAKVAVGFNTIELKEVGDIINARNEEIVRNVVHQIAESECIDSLGAGIVLTGGGSSLRNLESVFHNHIERLNSIRLVTEPLCGIEWSEPRWRTRDGSQLALLSVMVNGDENCCTFLNMDKIDRIETDASAQITQTSLFNEEGQPSEDVNREPEVIAPQQAEPEPEPEQEPEKPVEEKPAEIKSSKRKSNLVSKFLKGITGFIDNSEKFMEDDEQSKEKED